MSFGELHSHVANKADEITAMYELFKFNPRRDIRDRVQLTDVDRGKMHLCDFVHENLPSSRCDKFTYLSSAPRKFC